MAATAPSKAFPAAQQQLLFVFDYGDERLFHVVLRATSKKSAKVRYPRVVERHGAAPEQYPDPEEFDDEGPPRYGVNPITERR